MTNEIPHCPRCGVVIDPTGPCCPACGYEFLPPQERIRCNHCGHRIPAEFTVCPRCGIDPRSSRHPRLARLARASAILFAIFLVLCMAWTLFRAVTTNTLQRALGLGAPTVVPTQAVQFVYVIATSIPPPATRTPAFTLTPVPRTFTPTRPGARTPTLSRWTPTPPPIIYPVPQLTEPANGAAFEGADANIVLTWQPISAGGLAESDWYRISVSYSAKDGKSYEQFRWSKETHWQVLPEWWNDISPYERSLKWNVTVVRVDGIDPFAARTRSPISPRSATRSFTWD